MGIKDFLTKIFSFKKKEGELLKMLRYALKIEEEKISEAQAYELIEWIYTCIKVIAQRVAGLPFYIYDKEGKEIYDEPYKILKTPNPLMTGYSLFEGTVSWLYLKGFAVWYYNKNEKTLWLLPSDQVKIEIGEFKTINDISVKFGNEKYKFTDLIFFNFWNYKYPNAYWEGISPIQVLMNILQIEQKINKHHAIILDTLMNIKGFLTSEQPLTDEQRKSLEDSLRTKLMGYEKGAMIGILPQGFKFQPVDVKSEDASFVSLKKLNREAIAAALGVPPAIVGIFEYANYANVKEQLRLFWEYTGIPLCERITNVINSFFLPKYFGEYTFEFDYLSVPTLAETKREIMDTYARLVSSGIITINEAREEQGYKKVPWGNSWWGPMTLVPLATLVEEEGKVLKELKKQAFSKRRILTKEQRKMLWNGYDKILTAYEKIMRKQIKQFFNEQLKTIKEKIKQYFLSLEKELDIKSLNVKKIVREIYDIDYWQNRFLVLTRALMYDIIKTGGERALAMVLEGKKQEDYVLDMSRVEVYKWLEEWAGRRVRGIQETTRDRLIEVIEEGIKKGIEEGESIVQIEKRIEKMIENDFALSIPKRLEYIVRTETLGAMNFGHICGYEQSGVVEGKEWLATMDERVRDAHAEADGQIVGMDEPFVVGGEVLEYPGDPAGSPENVINCRCTVLPVLKEEF
jgi:HK97 family phage portal protein